LKDAKIQKQFQLELRNRFNLLSHDKLDLKEDHRKNDE